MAAVSGPGPGGVVAVVATGAAARGRGGGEANDASGVGGGDSGGVASVSAGVLRSGRRGGGDTRTSSSTLGSAGGGVSPSTRSRPCGPPTAHTSPPRSASDPESDASGARPSAWPWSSLPPADGPSGVTGLVERSSDSASNWKEPGSLPEVRLGVSTSPTPTGESERDGCVAREPGWLDGPRACLSPDPSPALPPSAAGLRPSLRPPLPSSSSSSDPMST